MPKYKKIRSEMLDCTFSGDAAAEAFKDNAETELIYWQAKWGEVAAALADVLGLEDEEE